MNSKNLPEPEKQEVAAEILQQAIAPGTPALLDEELALIAEAIFLSLDESEAEQQDSRSE